MLIQTKTHSSAIYFLPAAYNCQHLLTSVGKWGRSEEDYQSLSWVIFKSSIYIPINQPLIIHGTSFAISENARQF